MHIPESMVPPLKGIFFEGVRKESVLQADLLAGDKKILFIDYKGVAKDKKSHFYSKREHQKMTVLRL